MRLRAPPLPYRGMLIHCARGGARDVGSLLRKADTNISACEVLRAFGPLLTVCTALTRNPQVISGGFDCNIAFWDINTSRPKHLVDTGSLQGKRPFAANEVLPLCMHSVVRSRASRQPPRHSLFVHQVPEARVLPTRLVHIPLCSPVWWDTLQVGAR